MAKGDKKGEDTLAVIEAPEENGKSSKNVETSGGRLTIKATPKVYSPDITPFAFQGDTYWFGVLLSILVAPVRLVTRTMHNIFVLPADLQEGYARSLILVSSILLGIGVITAFVNHTWALFISQILALLFGLRLKKQATVSTKIAKRKKHVDIDLEEVRNTAETIYSELEKILEE